jgi:hypothetical protein
MNKLRGGTNNMKLGRKTGGGKSRDGRSSSWNVVWSAPVALAKVGRIKQIMRSSLNDVLLSCTAGAIRVYLQQQGIPFPDDVKVSKEFFMRINHFYQEVNAFSVLLSACVGLLYLTAVTDSERKAITTLYRESCVMGVFLGLVVFFFQAVIPVDLRNDIASPKTSTKLGCKIASVLATIPTGIESAIPRLWTTRHRLDELKASADPVVAYEATTVLMNLFPHQIGVKILESITNKVIPTSMMILSNSAFWVPTKQVQTRERQEGKAIIWFIIYFLFRAKPMFISWLNPEFMFSYTAGTTYFLVFLYHSFRPQLTVTEWNSGTSLLYFNYLHSSQPQLRRNVSR